MFVFYRLGVFVEQNLDVADALYFQSVALGYSGPPEVEAAACP
jgi:hypothetical protein